MRRREREVRSGTNYILVTDLCLLQNMVVRNARHNTYHYLVLGCLHGTAPTEHTQYLRKHKCFPIKPLMTLDRINHLFADLLGGHSQSTLEGTPPPGVDITKNLVSR